MSSPSEYDTRKNQGKASSLRHLLALLRPRRNFWVFLIFLGVSILFWCVQTFNERASINVSYGIRLINLPSDRIITSYWPEKITVSVSGKGFAFIGEMLDNSHEIIDIDFMSLPHDGEHAVIDINTWKKILAKHINENITINSVSSSPLEIYTSLGQYKQVPVVPVLKYSTAKDHVLLSSDIKPQYVNVYAPKTIYDTITAVYTKPKVFSNLTDTVSSYVKLEPVKGVKMVPDSVKVTMCVDLLTSKTVKVPITIERCPEKYNIKTFPHEIDVSFKICSSLYETINKNDFCVAVDYGTIHPADKNVKVILRSVPEGVSSVTVNPSRVEYIIEECR